MESREVTNKMKRRRFALYLGVKSCESKLKLIIVKTKMKINLLLAFKRTSCE